MGGASGRSGLLLVALVAGLAVAFLLSRTGRPVVRGGAAPRASDEGAPAATDELAPVTVPGEASPEVAPATAASAREEVRVAGPVEVDPAGAARVPLQPGEAVLQVRVRTAEDVLARGVQVALFTEGDVPLARRSSAAAQGALDEVLTADPGGRAEMRVLAGERYRLRVRAADGPDWPRAFKTTPELEPGDYRLVLVAFEELLGEGRLVRIVDEHTRLPVEGARVVLRSGPGGPVLSEFPVASDGLASVPGAGGRIEAPGYAPVSWSSRRSVAPVDEVALARFGALEVLVLDVEGAPLVEQRVVLDVAGEVSSREHGERRTGEEGTCLFEEVAPHAALVVEVPRAGAVVPALLRDPDGLAYGERRRVRIQVAEGTVLDGTVRGPDGRALVGATVSLWPTPTGDVSPLEGRRTTALAVTDESGAYRFTGVSPGQWTVGSGTVTGDVALRDRTCVIGGDRNVRVDLEGWRDLAIRGRFVGSNGAAVAPREAGLVTAETSGHSLATHALGDTFVLEPLIDAPYRLHLFADGRRIELDDVRPGGEPLRVVLDE